MTREAGPRFVRADLVPLPNGGSAVTTPRGRVFRVDLDHAELAAILASCDGNTSLRDLVAGRPRANDLLALLEMLLDQGCLAEADGKPGPALRNAVRFSGPGIRDAGNPSVVIVGSGRIASIASALVCDGPGQRFRSVRCEETWSDTLAAELSGGAVVLVFADRPDTDLEDRVGRDCAVHHVSWSRFTADAHRGWFGPHIGTDGGPDFADLRDRRMAAARDPDLVRAQLASTPHRDTYLPPADEITWMLSAFLVDVARWSGGVPALGSRHEVELDPVALRIERHPVLPFPDRSGGTCRTAPGIDPVTTLVDRRTGIIIDLIDVAHDRRFPPSLSTVQALACDVSRVRPWRNDPVGGGSGFAGPEAARNAAIGEVIERYCGNIVRPELVSFASFDELCAAGERALDPATLVLFSKAQYDAPGFPFVPLTRSSATHWVCGRSLTRDEPAWLPASLVYTNWYNSGWSDGAPINGTSFAGIAAGRDVRSSVTSGLQEVIERHATMVWWLNHWPLPGVRPTPALRSLWTERERGPLRHWLINLDNEFSVPVLAGVVEDTERSVLTVGFAARSSPEEAAMKAWAEALVLQDIARDLLSPRGAYYAVVERGRLPDQGLKPWRPDRRYLDDYREDFRDVSSLLCQLQVHLDTRAQNLVRPWVDVEATRRMAEVGELDEEGLEAYQSAVEARGYEVFYADITTPDVAAAGLTVTRTIVPGTVGNSPAAFPFLGRGVVQDGAVQLGWRSRPLAEDEVTSIPMPHA